MKVIDLLNKIANGEDVPKRIKLKGNFYYYDTKDKNYINEDSDAYVDNYENKWIDSQICMDSQEDLNIEIEIIEEEPEIDIQGIKDLPDYDMGIEVNKNKINELIKAVKQLDNKIKEKE